MDEEQFFGMFRSCSAAFRLEWQQDPVPDEEAAFTCWLAGNPPLPSQWPMWADWLEFTRQLGNKITRVRLIDDPPTQYQQWGMWAIPYHRDAGDDIRCMPLSLAGKLRIVAANWWLFDNQLVTMDGTSKTLVTDPGMIRTHRAWRDLALKTLTTPSASYEGEVNLALRGD